MMRMPVIRVSPHDCVPPPDAYVRRLHSKTPSMSAIDSPCNKVCTLDPVSALCLGCGRTLREIELWPRLGPDERRRIMAELAARKSALAVRRRRADVT